MTRSESHLCSICHRAFEEYGNNADPINKGRCCNRCADLYVIPARIKQMREEVTNE
jgi:hypothetical protein